MLNVHLELNLKTEFGWVNKIMLFGNMSIWRLCYQKCKYAKIHSFLALLVWGKWDKTDLSNNLLKEKSWFGINIGVLNKVLLSDS